MLKNYKRLEKDRAKINKFKLIQTYVKFVYSYEILLEKK